ncbi:unnamed protein product [Thelazia callipaeda]|uniref:C3H1-type domain-containing protein n=1 Tax=Thelazia callipaeda TaxID=103827 RepID=A0A0N5D3D6_THECL|nr:unnamed protein product [Thelazia callipaeda]
MHIHFLIDIIFKMATLYQHLAPNDLSATYQFQEMQALPAQNLSFSPQSMPFTQPQGTVYFQPPYIFPSGLPQMTVGEMFNMPQAMENTSMEIVSNDNSPLQGLHSTMSEMQTNAMYYPQPPTLTIPFSPAMQALPYINQYIRPGPILILLPPPVPDASTPVNPMLQVPVSSTFKPGAAIPALPASFGSYPHWSTTSATSQSPTLKITPRKEAFSMNLNQAPHKIVSIDASKNSSKENSNRNELMYRNRSGGPSLNNYRTKLCINFKNGHCSYGDKCRFIHQQPIDDSMKTKFSTNAPAFVPRANLIHTKQTSPSASVEVPASNRLYSSTPVSLLTKSPANGLDLKETVATPTNRRVSYRHDFSAVREKKGLSMDQALNFCVRVAVATAASVIVMKMVLKYVDPNHAINKLARKKAIQVMKALGLDPSIELNEHELRIATQFVHCDDGADWCDIGGCRAVIEEINDRIIIPLKIRNVYKKFAISSSLLSPPKGVLLYGPPGCGKTLIAKIIARAANARFINLQVSSLCDKWYGESQKLADAVFSVAQKFQPTIIFIDEIDSFLRDRNTQDHEATAMMKAQFMCLWDGFASSDDAIVVLGATNRPNDVDSAILRRMPARFYVPLPNLDSRIDILRVLLKNQPVMPEIDFERIAEYASELSGSDLKEVCRLAVSSRVKDAFLKGEDLNDENTRIVRETDLMQAVIKYKQTTQISGLRGRTS